MGPQTSGQAQNHNYFKSSKLNQTFQSIMRQYLLTDGFVEKNADYQSLAILNMRQIVFHFLSMIVVKTFFLSKKEIMLFFNNTKKNLIKIFSQVPALDSLL